MISSCEFLWGEQNMPIQYKRLGWWGGSVGKRKVNNPITVNLVFWIPNHRIFYVKYGFPCVYVFLCVYIYKVSGKQSQTHYQHVNEYLEVTGPACACPALLTSGAITRAHSQCVHLYCQAVVCIRPVRQVYSHCQVCEASVPLQLLLWLSLQGRLAAASSRGLCWFPISRSHFLVSEKCQGIYLKCCSQSRLI